MAINIIFIALSLIFNCPSFKLTIAIYKGFLIKCSLLYIPYDPYIPIQSSNIIQHYFWPIKAWDSWPNPLILKVENAKKVPMPF